MWANTVAAYEALPPVLSSLADQLGRYSNTIPTRTTMPGRGSLVEHLVRDEGVAGSNPATPTKT